MEEDLKNNDLKMKLIIEMEQYEDSELLSEYKSTETLRYPTLYNEQANQISMDLNMVIKAAITDYIRGMANEKAERKSEIIKKEDYSKGAIR